MLPLQPRYPRVTPRAYLQASLSRASPCRLAINKFDCIVIVENASVNQLQACNS
jgi:hypothetical protein